MRATSDSLLTSSILRATNARDEAAFMDRNELKRRQLGLDHYPRVRSTDMLALAFASVAFGMIWIWCKLTGKKPEDVI